MLGNRDCQIFEHSRNISHETEKKNIVKNAEEMLIKNNDL